MSRKSDPTKTYCTLREAFDLVGAKVCGSKWQGSEADCDPARAEQRQPGLPRPIDGKDGARLEQATKRHIKALAEFLRFTHSGALPTYFIPKNAATAKEAINAVVGRDGHCRGQSVTHLLRKRRPRQNSHRPVIAEHVGRNLVW